MRGLFINKKAGGAQANHDIVKAAHNISTSRHIKTKKEMEKQELRQININKRIVKRKDAYASILIRMLRYITDNTHPFEQSIHCGFLFQ